TGGGGGVGRPEERDPQAVWDDVYINELVTVQGAREIYKVVIDPETRRIDRDRTKSVRAAGGAARGDGDACAQFEPNRLRDA
ncbi:MAG: hypothetical protein ACE5G5_02120, partial [Candidatus Methylomirabilales bacterium]